MPPLDMTLKDANGDPVNLDALNYSSIVFNMRPEGAKTNKLTIQAGTCSLINDGTDGKIRYEWSEGSTDAVEGPYLGQVVISTPDGKEWYFPNNNDIEPFIPIEILPKL